MGIADSFGAGVNAVGGIYRNQMLRDQAAQYPQLLQADLTNKNLVNQWYAPMQQADIASKYAYASLIPYQALGTVLNNPMGWYMMQNGMIRLPNTNGGQVPSTATAIPPLTSTDGGFTVQPQTTNLSSIPTTLRSPNAPLTTGGLAAPNYPVLPGGTPQGNIMPTLNGGPTGGIGAPLPPSGMNNFNNFMANTPNPLSIKALGDSMNTQATNDVDQYTKALSAAAQQADIANQMQNFSDQFQNAYKNSYYKGGITGTIDTKGVSSIPFRLYKDGNAGTNLANEQAADQASQNLAALVAKTIAGGRVTNYEMQYINNLKPNRAMDADTAQMASDFLKQKSIRMQEELSFLNAAKQQQIDPNTANTLWNLYQNQRPVYDFPAQKPNLNFAGTWQEYLQPQIVNAVKGGQTPVLMPSFDSKQQFQDWVRALPPAMAQQVKSQLAVGSK